MTIRDLITQEAAEIRTKAATYVQEAKDKAAQLVADAEQEALKFEADAQALEAKLGSLPAELEGLVEESAKSVWQWVKSL